MIISKLVFSGISKNRLIFSFLYIYLCLYICIKQNQSSMIIDFLNCSFVYILTLKTNSVDKKKVLKKRLPIISNTIELSKLHNIELTVKGQTFTVNADAEIGISKDYIIGTSTNAIEKAIKNK